MDVLVELEADEADGNPSSVTARILDLWGHDRSREFAKCRWYARPADIADDVLASHPHADALAPNEVRRRQNVVATRRGSGVRRVVPARRRAAASAPTRICSDPLPPTSGVASPLATRAERVRNAPRARTETRNERTALPHRVVPPPHPAHLLTLPPPRSLLLPRIPQIFVSNATGNVRITSIVRVCRVAFPPEENPDPDQEGDEPPVFYCRSQYFEKQVRGKGRVRRGGGGGGGRGGGGGGGVTPKGAVGAHCGGCAA